MKISIVMPSLNQAEFLPQAIDSVLGQQACPELELIVVDGGSTDGSVDILRACRDPRFVWSSGPDAGQSDAINKGMAKATGDILAWLNSDDFYHEGALEAVAQAFQDNPQHAWVTGHCRIIDRDGRQVRPMVARYKNRCLERYSPNTLLSENYISQPATFWRRSAWEEAGPLDTALHWTMDYDLWLRLSQISAPVVVRSELASFRLYESSKSGNFNREQYDEGYRVACRYIPRFSLRKLAHRLHVEKIVLSYRLARLLRI